MASSIFNRLKSNRHVSQTLISNVCSVRSVYTGRFANINLYSRISPLGTPNLSLFQCLINGWRREKGQRRRASPHYSRSPLRKRYAQALEVCDFYLNAHFVKVVNLIEVSEWMSSKELCPFSPSARAVQLDLIGQNVSLISPSPIAEDEGVGFCFHSSPYNGLMCLYINTDQLEKIPDVLSEMQENGISPDNFSYRLCINSYGARSDLNSMEKILEEMESKSHIHIDWMTYSMVANFYIKAGLNEKALFFLKKAETKLHKDPLGYNHLIHYMQVSGVKLNDEIVEPGYIEKQNMEKAFECMKEAIAVLAENKGWRPKPKVISSILSWLGDNRDVEEVETFVSALKAVIPVDREMYHAQIRASIRAGKEVDEILDSMKADKIDEDEETRKILSLKHDKAE
ncbi:Pentatricopeptide repeat-containing protein, mitochondrial [Vitis vinifera]|uniref:Pentatricopeptide repeat-containing protein, mitochondrial n=1 Tax=Vitis vinifera TaxID=29760 RepID=A0A438I8V1_VITVI|nr:Pentatricopeptide repeat-containing protein, mitochondrial [Vitis vinifera]